MRALALFLLLALALPVSAAKLELHKPAPELSATTLDGRAISTSQLRGKVVIVHFWATWCAPCREEMPVLDAFYRKHRDEGVEVIAVSLDESSDLPAVKQVMAQFQYPAAMAADTQAKGYGRLSRAPLTFVIDRQGNLRRNAWTAAPKVDAASLDADVLPLLSER